MRFEVNQAVTFFSTQNGRYLGAAPPRDVVTDMLSNPQLPLPPLRRVVNVPVFSADGHLVTGGYDGRSGIYCDPGTGFVLPAVPTAPSAEEIAEARRLLEFEVLGDFPFDGGDDGAASRAHALALMLQPFAREMIAGPTPIWVVDKPAAGTGGSLFVDCFALITTGRGGAQFEFRGLNLRSWAATYGQLYRIEDALRTHAPDKVIEQRANDGRGVHITCPFEAGHSQSPPPRAAGPKRPSRCPPLTTGSRAPQEAGHGGLPFLPGTPNALKAPGGPKLMSDATGIRNTTCGRRRCLCTLNVEPFSRAGPGSDRSEEGTTGRNDGAGSRVRRGAVADRLTAAPAPADRVLHRPIRPVRRVTRRRVAPGSNGSGGGAPGTLRSRRSPAGSPAAAPRSATGARCARSPRCWRPRPAAPRAERITLCAEMPRRLPIAFSDRPVP